MEKVYGSYGKKRVLHLIEPLKDKSGKIIKLPKRIEVKDKKGKILKTKIVKEIQYTFVECDLTYYHPISSDQCLKLWFNVLNDGLSSASWKRITNKGKTKITSHDKEYRKHETEIFEFWDYDRRDRAWVMSDEININSFLSICEALELNHLKIRKAITPLPVDFFEGKRFLKLETQLVKKEIKNENRRPEKNKVKRSFSTVAKMVNE